MEKPKIIARAYGGEPLLRMAGVQNRGLVYIKNPDSLDDDSFVGFPRQDVFAMDESIFEVLKQEWIEEGKTNQSTWAKLNRYGQDTLN